MVPPEYEDYPVNDDSGYAGAFHAQYLAAKLKNKSKYLREVEELEPLKLAIIDAMRRFDDEWPSVICAAFNPSHENDVEEETPIPAPMKGARGTYLAHNTYGESLPRSGVCSPSLFNEVFHGLNGSLDERQKNPDVYELSHYVYCPYLNLISLF